jgi:NADPH-dependent F420 reductase
MPLKIGLVGGTGDIGSALAVHLAKRNQTVLMGSRSKDKAKSVILNILNEKGDQAYLRDNLEPVTNELVVSTCDVIIFTVPYSAALDTITSLRDKFSNDQLLISTVAGIERTSDEFVPVRNQASITKSIREMVPKSVHVAAAFQTIPAGVLYKEEKLEADVLICSDDKATYLRTAEVVSSIEGLRPLYVGSLEISYEIEALTAILLNLARNQKLKSPTFKVLSF